MKTPTALDALDAGMLDPSHVAELCQMSTADLKAMLGPIDFNECLELEDAALRGLEVTGDQDDPLDDFDYVGSRHHY